MVWVKGLNIGSGRPKICAPLIGAVREEVLREAVLAREAGADLVEWRVDHYREVFSFDEVAETLVLIHEMLDGLPLLFTFRTLAEGGEQDISIRQYRDLYEHVIHTGLVDMVDIELFKVESLGKRLIEEIKSLNIPLIISSHDFKETPADPVLLYRLNVMEHFGADIGKLAVTPNNERDVLRLMELTRRANAFVSMPIITMSMGNLGKISGPAALRCSSFVNKELEKTGEPVTLSLDCFPTQTKQELIHILTEKSKATKKNLVNAWHGILPERLLVFFLERLEMDHLTGQQASQKQIQDFVQLCKEFKLSINKTFPIEKSFVTGGGVSLKEIYPKTLESKIIDGLYFAGELLDVNGYTGGFNITAAFATGHVAGMNAGQRA